MNGIVVGLATITAAANTSTTIVNIAIFLVVRVTFQPLTAVSPASL